MFLFYAAVAGLDAPRRSAAFKLLLLGSPRRWAALGRGGSRWRSVGLAGCPEGCARWSDDAGDSPAARRGPGMAARPSWLVALHALAQAPFPSRFE